jgi:hypothetical protein
MSCKKDKVGDNAPCTTCQSVTEAKDYFAFKVGSWWVYEEETSHERDSVYVTQSTIGSDYMFDTYMYSELQGYYYHYYPLYINNNVCSKTEPTKSKCLFVTRAKQKPGDYIGENYCFFVNYSVGSYETEFNICNPNNRVIISNVFNEFDLGLFHFNKTVIVHELCTFIENCQPTNHYFSKNIGLIRKELLDSNEVWNLINYHIEI